MARSFLLFAPISFYLYHTNTVSATTTVQFYTDASCNSLYATVQTDTDAGNGQCGILPLSINSASSVYVDNGCSVTTYSPPSRLYCDNNGTVVPLTLCTSMSIGSFSVDCMGINGTYEPAYSTILASSTSSNEEVGLPSTFSSSTSTSTSTSTSASKSTTPMSPTSPSHQEITTSIHSHTPSSTTPSSLLQTQTQTSTSLSPSPSQSPLQADNQITSSSPSSKSQPPSSSPTSLPSSSTSHASNNSGNDGGLSGPSTIAIEVVLPGVGVIVAILFGVLGVKRFRNGERILPHRRWSV